MAERGAQRGAGPGSGLRALRFAAAAVRRRVADEWRTTPVHEALISRPRASGLAARPRDLRPARPEVGRAVLDGRFPLAGQMLEAGVGGDPWAASAPGRRFAVALHRFEWLPALTAEGDAGAREGLRLALGWRRLFDRPSAFSWSAEVIERRVFNLACALGPLAAEASEREAAALAQSLARQARHLLGVSGRPSRRAERLAAAAVAGAALAGEAGARLLAQASRRLGRALDEAVLADGGLRTRSPEQAMELLFDLMTFDDALVQRGRAAPDGVARALDRLGGAVRVFALPDGRLATLQGGGGSDPARVAAALAYDETAGRPYDYAPHSGYHRLQAPGLTVMVDAAPPAPPGWDDAACAQPLAVEVVAGRERLITGGGWSPDASAPEALRLSPAASTATAAETSPGRPRTGAAARWLGPGLVGGAQEVEGAREAEGGGVWLELAHDGWARSLGLIHGRRLFLDAATPELRGEDLFTEAPGMRARAATPFAVRFHLPPGVRAALARDGRSLLLRTAGGQAWWLRNDAEEAAVEDSVVVVEGLPRRASQVVLRGVVGVRDGRPDGRVRWKLAPVQPVPHKARP